MTPLVALGTAARAIAAVTVARNLLRVARRVDPVAPCDDDHGTISVVVPARDEASRIGPLLASLAAAPGVLQVVVVDDESADGTAEIARTAGAQVVVGAPPPAGWIGKTWALQQGLDAAAGEWVVFLDADTRPDPRLPRSLVARCATDGLDLLTVAGRFECPTAGLRWLHPALLTTLVYRTPPPGARDQGPPGRRVGNGQCMVARAATLRGAGAFAAVAGHAVEDVALVRAWAGARRAVGYLDATDLLTVRMYERAGEAWLGWGRSLALPGVDPRARQLLGLAVVALAQALPLVRLLGRRADALDAVLLVLRAGTLAGTARAYTTRGVAYWLSPLADAAAVAALVRSTVATPRAWRGRVTASPSRTAGRPAT
jgi:dolichol-phosphate mannosyltransferase